MPPLKYRPFFTASWIAATLVALLVGGTRAAAASEPERKFRLQERAVPGALQSVRIRDMDGDGRADLFYVAATATGREVGFFRGRRRGGFEPTPAMRLRLKRDAVLVALGDLDAAAGTEIALIGPSSVFVYRHSLPEERQRYRRLFREQGFFATADPRRAPIWPHVRDVDGDGLEDVCLPVWGGVVVRFQARSAAGEASFGARAFVPAWLDRGRAGGGGGRMNLALSFGGGRGGGGNRNGNGNGRPPVGGYMVESVRRMSAPVLVDENGDGRLDVMLLEGGRLKVWRLRKDRTYAVEPDVAQDLSEMLGRTPRWAPSGNLVPADVDGDGRLDFLVRQAVEDNVRTRLLYFPGGIEALTRRPRRILLLGGLTRRARFQDVNGDGRPDLLVPTFRVDLMQQMRRGPMRSLDVTLWVFLQREKEGFPRRPDYRRTVSLRVDRLPESGAEPLVYLDGDFNRDRRSDLLLIDERGRLQIFLSTETGGGLFARGGSFTFQDDPAVSVPVDPPRKVRVVDHDGDGVSEVLLLYERKFVLGGWGLPEEKKP